MSSMTSMIAATAWFAASAAAQVPKPEVAIYRSWRAPDATVVEGMFRVDPDLLGTSDCRYGVELIVRDAQGTTLQQESWAGQCPQRAGQMAPALETFTFAMPSAKFTVEVVVYPQAQPQQRRSATVEVQGLPAQPVMSDLVLAQTVGIVDTTRVQAWTMRRGTIGLEVPSTLIVQPTNPKLTFYLELYPPAQRALRGAVVGVIKRADGKELTRVALEQLDGWTEARPIAGTIPLAGLPAGAYTFEARLQLVDTTMVRRRAFEVAPAVLATSWFDTVSDERVTELFDAVVAFGLTKHEVELYESLPPTGKRTFLTKQFGPEGPTPNDGRESAIDAYLARIEHVRAFFPERAGRAGVDAWRTARGRIWMRRGQPSSQTAKARPSSGSPYEIWHYSTNPAYVYLFADESGMGHYRLLYTNDPDEQSVINWDRFIAAEALEDLARLGFRPRTGGGSNNQD